MSNNSNWSPAGKNPLPAFIDGHDIAVDPSFEAWANREDGPEVELAIVFPAEVHESRVGNRFSWREAWTATLQNNGDWTYEVAPSVEVQDHLEKNKAYFMRLPRV